MMTRNDLITYLTKTALLGAKEVFSRHEVNYRQIDAMPVSALKGYTAHTEAWMRGAVSKEILDAGRTLVAWSGFVWTQHAVLSSVLDALDEGGTRPPLPYTPGDALAEGYGYLIVEAWGWTLPMIVLEEHDRIR